MVAQNLTKTLCVGFSFNLSLILAHCLEYDPCTGNTTSGTMTVIRNKLTLLLELTIDLVMNQSQLGCQLYDV